MEKGRRPPMTHPPHELAWRAFTTALGLYGRHFGLLTALSFFPAAARLAYFLGVSWMSGAVSGLVELVVAGFRIALLLAAVRAVWPQGLAGLQNALKQGTLFSRLSWPEIGWQVLIFALVIAALNLSAGWLANIGSTDPRFETASLFGLKNLFIIPFATLYLLVAAKVTLRL